jgi:hypothetical protein
VCACLFVCVCVFLWLCVCRCLYIRCWISSVCLQMDSVELACLAHQVPYVMLLHLLCAYVAALHLAIKRLHCLFCLHSLASSSEVWNPIWRTERSCWWRQTSGTKSSPGELCVVCVCDVFRWLSKVAGQCRQAVTFIYQRGYGVV